MFKEFRDFLFRGNVVDLAVALVIAAAFGAIIKSFVNNILTPLIGLFGIPDMSTWSLQGRQAQIMYGLFLQDVHLLRDRRRRALLLPDQAMNALKRAARPASTPRRRPRRARSAPRRSRYGDPLPELHAATTRLTSARVGHIDLTHNGG